MLTTSDVIERFKEVQTVKYDYSKFVYNGMHKKSCIICPEHGEFWQSPHSHLKGQGCPKCGLLSRTKKRLYNNELFIEKSRKKHGDKYDYSKVEYKDSQTYVTIICPVHGEFQQKPYCHLNGQGCPKCYDEKRGGSQKKGINDFIDKLHQIYGDKYDFTKYNYINYNTREEVICPEHGVFYRNIYELLNGKECPICMKKERKIKTKITNFNKFLEKAREIHGNKYDYSKVKYISCYTPIDIICPKHGVFLQKPTYHLSGNGCQICAGEMTKSNAEIEIMNFIENLGFVVKTSARNIIFPYELDIYIQSKRIAIEYDGLYWHNEINKDKNYHLMKTELCEKQGIRLIHIFEDEWLEHEDIVKSRLKAILGLSERKIFARKCIVKEIGYKDSREFLKKNHIQGDCMSRYRYGLYYNNELVSIMTFGKKRRNLGSKQCDDAYELIRFCNRINTSVIGGASKLLKHFIKEIKPKEIISYCDRRWSNGDLYEKLGFKKIHYSKPSYFYVKNEKRYNRFNFRKDVLVKEGFDENKSEHEIMLERNIYRIYDCGSILYRL